MTTTVRKDLDALTMEIAAEFEAPVDRIWQMWDNPRLLERWWGPPTHPATMVEHDLTPVGKVRYYMTGPEGEKYHGWWKITAVEAPTRLEFDDGFADEHGNPLDEMPSMSVRVTLAENSGTTRMSIASIFRSKEDMVEILAMGAEEGMIAAVGQIEGLLAETA